MTTPGTDQPQERPRVQHEGGGVSKTRQSDTLKTDVRAILGRYIAHGTPPGGLLREANYGDFTNVDSYHAALNMLREAQLSFNALPAAVRRRCANDPGLFLELVYNPENRHELEQLGLVEALTPKDAPPSKPPPEEPPPEE